MDNNSQESNPQDKRSPKESPRWESTYSYIDYAMDHKVFKRIWWTLTAVILVATPLLSVFLYFTGSTYREAQSLVQQTQAAYDRFEEAYDYFQAQDSTQAIRIENSHYYFYSIPPKSDNLIVEAMNSLLVNQGFGSQSVDIDSALNRYLYYEQGYDANPAKDFASDEATKDPSKVFIGVLHNGMPLAMLNRVDSLFGTVYGNPVIKRFPELRIPPGGFLYCVDYQNH